MVTYTQGNLLEADVDAVVNTVNTVGIMGKGIALMFKEQFPRNFEAYARACDAGEVRIGKMFVTENKELFGPRWIINFPTKTHWRVKTKIEWVEDGLKDLVRVIREKKIHSIAIPPLGCGNGGLDWGDVRPLIEVALAELDGVNAIVYEPTSKYQNVAKRTGVEKLTPARALVAEMVRRYCLLGIDCSILEVQKLGWFIERGVRRFQVSDPLKFEFQANRYGPYSHNLTKLLDSLDGSYLLCDKRLADADPLDLIWFNEAKYDRVKAYLNSGEGKEFSRVLEWAATTIDGFESPLGMELLATIDWMKQHDGIEPTVEGVMEGLKEWAGGEAAGQRKLKIFDPRLVAIALEKLEASNRLPA
ncbi:macro domain-containing protein [Zhengella sp. ZM62]|uniref:type II toxin-antitoxin system antitoxin DNA ADP-ribosyl glycohydrolase DarG n=1 Tax=Zhengella sedimenti TaxID=3390035 RepID=UPI003975046E